MKMILPSITHGLLNATSLLLANLTGKHDPIYCYQQRPADQPQRLPVLSIDCFTLAQKILRGHRYPRQPLAWSRDATKGLELPRIFSDKTCVFELDLPQGRRGAWEASLSDIAFASNDIVAPCVHDGVHLGGLTRVGPESMLILMVYGQEYENPEPNGGLKSE